jgi:pantoate kinase
LSKGVLSRASVERVGRGNAVSVIVNGDSAYDARTTRRALSILFERYGPTFGKLLLEQSVDVPIGAGFGASAASAVSAVYAAASALGVDAPRSALARCAYDAEILEQTGLGTVSVAYAATGAGAITSPGPPGVARFLNVKVPDETRLVTASLAPYEKRDALSSPERASRIVRLGDEALRRFLDNATFTGLAEAGEWFSKNLELRTGEVGKLTEAASAAGASYTGQNMIGHVVHSLAREDDVAAVVRALNKTGMNPRIDVFEVGAVGACVLADS